MLVTGNVTAVVPLGNESVTVAPPAGAISFSTTVPVEDWPGAMVGGLKKISVTVGGGGVTISVTAWGVPPPSVAVIVTLCTIVTASVVTTKVAVEFPAATITVGAICTDVSELISVTVVGFPPGAAAESVTVAGVFCPPTMVFCPPTMRLAGSVTLSSVGGGTTVSVAIRCDALSVAVIVAVAGGSAGLVAPNVVLIAPAGRTTFALGWKLTEGSLLESATVVPPGCAGPESVTVPMEDAPSATVAGFRVSALTVSADAATIVSVPVCVLVPSVAVMVTICVVVTAVVVIRKVAKVLPAGTMTLGGTVAAVLLLDSATGIPPCGAVAETVIVPLVCNPPVVVEGNRLMDETVSAAVTTLSMTLCDTAFSVPGFCVAEMNTCRAVGTTIVVNMNCACMAPAGMVTVAGSFGTVTVSLVKSVRGIPPLGAGWLSSTVPVVAVPPTTGLG